jgi:hypothetical protein
LKGWFRRLRSAEVSSGGYNRVPREPDRDDKDFVLGYVGFLSGPVRGIDSFAGL